MKTYVVWVEMDLAKVFWIWADGPRSEIIRQYEIKDLPGKNPESTKDLERFFREVAGLIEDAAELYLIGPGLAKEHFKGHLRDEHPDTLARRLVGTATVDDLSDARVLALSRRFFRERDPYQAPTVRRA